VRRKTLGRSTAQVTELGFGGAQIGNLYTATDDATAAAAVAGAWEVGVRYFDTAPHYGLGLSERRLGAALAGCARDSFVVSTKVGRLVVPNPAATGSVGAEGFAVTDELMRRYDYSRDGVRRSLEESLTRLGLDRVDIVYVHDPDDHMDQAVAEAVPALVELREQGVVAAVGAGMNDWRPLLRIVKETEVDAVMLAGRWTLLDRSGAPLLEECRQRGVSVVAAAPFNSGLLARRQPPEGAPFDYGPAGAEVLDRARRLAAVCEEHGTALPEAAMSFPARHPAVACVVAGMRTAAQARASGAFLQATISEETWAALDRVVDGWVPPPA
jgi:D-threo-aldose 1-dehydrogenase